MWKVFNGIQKVQDANKTSIAMMVICDGADGNGDGDGDGGGDGGGRCHCHDDLWL